MKIRFNTPQEQAAFEAGRKVGKVEGMIAFADNVLKNVQKGKDMLIAKLPKEDRGGREYN